MENLCFRSSFSSLVTELYYEIFTLGSSAFVIIQAFKTILLNMKREDNIKIYNYELSSKLEK